MAGRLEGQRALVTGAGRGFGRAIAERLAEEGAKVALLARSLDQLEETARGIAGKGGAAMALRCDVASREEVHSAVAEAAGAWGPLTLIVSNAGVPGPFGPIGEVDPDQWWAAQAVHLRAPLLLMSAALPGMIRAGGGRIICISAKASVLTAPNLSAYCVGKTALNRLVEHVQAENRGKNIHAFALQPGTVVTQLAEETMASPDARKWLPAMTERLATLRGTKEGIRDLSICADVCVRMAAGELDPLAGRYLDIAFDLDAMLAEAKAKAAEN
jgi:NAD(P)-dependent dehydrogenase (short-subunit alcohol dehydrogenase family)